jgi:transcriptional regulator with XRE-family HTH domain
LLAGQDDRRIGFADPSSVHQLSDCRLTHSSCSHIMDTRSRGFVHDPGNYAMNRLFYLPIVEERPLHFLREWRKFRHMTQQELADAVGTSKTVVSEMERGNLQLSPKWLRKFAPVLRTQPGHILDHDPESLDTDIIDIWAHIPERDKDTARRVLESFRRTGTE